MDFPPDCAALRHRPPTSCFTAQTRPFLSNTSSHGKARLVNSISLRETQFFVDIDTCWLSTPLLGRFFYEET